MIFGFVDPIAKLLGDWSIKITIGSVILRLFLSILLAAFLGFERSIKRHSAGLRTYILVSISGTVATIIDVYILSNLFILSAAVIIASAIISANTMLYTSRSQIKGLTTSVGLWASALVGLSLGAGLYTIAILAFIAVLVSLSMFPKLERYLKDRSNHFEMNIELKAATYLKDFVQTIRELGLKVDDLESNPAYINSGISAYSVSVSIISKDLKKYKTHTEIIEALRTLDYINYIEEM